MTCSVLLSLLVAQRSAVCSLYVTLWLVTSTVHTLVMIPALYAVVQGRRLRRQLRDEAGGDSLPASGDLALEPLAPEARAHDAPPTP